MHTVSRRQREVASRLRQRLRGLDEAMGEVLAHLLSAGPLLPGTLYLLRRRCGNPTCHCAKGIRHRTWVWTGGVGGTRRLLVPPLAEVARWRALTHQARQFRRYRQQWTALARAVEGGLRRLERRLRVGPGRAA